MEQQSAPPGWYPDPQTGAQRYWDGTQWTQHAPVAASGPVDPYANSKQLAMFAHLSALLTGFIGPLIFDLVQKDEDPCVADQSREALNFILSFLIYFLAGFAATFILFFVLIGILLIPLLFAMGIAWLVLAIIGGVKANRGEAYRYPLTIRMVS